MAAEGFGRDTESRGAELAPHTYSLRFSNMISTRHSDIMISPIELDRPLTLSCEPRVPIEECGVSPSAPRPTPDNRKEKASSNTLVKAVRSPQMM